MTRAGPGADLGVQWAFRYGSGRDQLEPRDGSAQVSSGTWTGGPGLIFMSSIKSSRAHGLSTSSEGAELFVQQYGCCSFRF